MMGKIIDFFRGAKNHEPDTTLPPELVYTDAGGNILPAGEVALCKHCCMAYRIGQGRCPKR